jgi:hypothetical protein
MPITAVKQVIFFLHAKIDFAMSRLGEFDLHNRQIDHFKLNF